MSSPSRLWQNLVLIVMSLVILGGAVWLLWLGGGKQKPPDNPAPAKTKTINETELNVIKLTAKAEDRLGLKTAPLTRQNRRQYRVVGGEVMAVPGQSVVVSTPLAGRLEAPPKGTVPPAGQRVKRDQVIFQLIPLLTPDARTTLITALVDVEGTLATTRTDKEAAQIALTRAQNVLKEGGGSRRAVDEAQARVDLASRAVEAAQARRDLLKKLLGDVDAGVIPPVMLTAPDEGILRMVSARAGQIVPAGAPIFEVGNLKQVWLRVPLYVGELAGIDEKSNVQFGRMGQLLDDKAATATPVKEPPPMASALASSADLFYQTDNSADWRPGQRVSVKLPLRQEESVPVIAWSSIQFDVNGGAWVYENPAPRTYQRRRVRVVHVEGNDAILETGLKDGTRIAIEGVAELFGAEVGLGQKAGAKFVEDQ